MSAAQLLHRPIFGGVFGDEGRYALASVPCISNGLHATRYMVVQPTAGVVLSVSEDKAHALAIARLRLNAANDNHHMQPNSAVQFELWPDEPLLVTVPGPPAARYVSRRRRSIYERSGGQCHYCSTQLELTGKWHVEHQLPRALGGGDESLNLVAACVRCNLSKGDSTAIEFAARAASAPSTPSD